MAVTRAGVLLGQALHVGDQVRQQLARVLAEAGEVLDDALEQVVVVLVEGVDVGEVLVVVLLEVVEVLVELRHEELDLVVGAAPVVLDLALELRDEGRERRQLLLVVVRLLLDAAVDLLAHAVQVLDVRVHLAQQLVDVRLELLRPLRDRLEGRLRLLGLVRELLVELLVAGDAVGQRRVRLVADEVDALGEDLRAVHPPVDVLVGRLRSEASLSVTSTASSIMWLSSPRSTIAQGLHLPNLCGRPARHSLAACDRAATRSDAGGVWCRYTEKARPRS